jgi:hypothetical protein
VRFRTAIELGGKTATGMEVPESVVEALGSGRRPAVVVTLNGYTYRSIVAVMGGRYLLPVAAEVRAGSGVAAGDQVEVEVELDTEPRAVSVPADLAAALDSDPPARDAFGALSYSNQRRHVLSVEGAKTPETRARRIAKVLTDLH